ncbi:hypothetical protein SAMN02745157_1113 [Kaistia soli DSM 19436]|uniref:Uncharacterized protein n=1 Tax=Kaistia soli DSM 19436 TaxID=1122133 RepID=A0A1M4X0L6_9HYPH|nr:hypothetical protein [Kaistia soli]SHE86917.1 hypothetical protein SAMN02745157_1113 [Kaistia soli DSM 19436]
MLAIVVYMCVAAALGLGSQIIRPSAALGSNHHRKLYWTGAMAAIALVGLFAGALVI